MSNNEGLLITNNNIYGLVNPPPKPSYQDGATQAQNIASSAVRWDKFVDLSTNLYDLSTNIWTNFYDLSTNFTDFSNNFIGGGGGGSGTINTGEYDKDISNNFTLVTNPINRDISGLYFDTNEFDISFNTVSGKENIYVGLKQNGGNVNQDYIDELFFDPPKAVTGDNIGLQTTTPPRLDASWNNPTQIRTAFDFLGNLGPIADDGASSLSTDNDESRDDYNFLPYFQGLKIQYLCYDGNSVVSGNDWTTVPVGNLTSLPPSSGVSYWNNTNGENFLPRFIRKVIIYAEASSTQISPISASDISNGIVIFPDAVLTSPFTVDDSRSYAFSLPRYVPGTTGTTNVGTAGKKIQLRVAMINRARASIADPSYNTGHGLLSQDVSWNWVYMPDISGIALGNYGGPTAPLTFTTPTNPSSFHDRFTLSGQNDNSGNGTSHLQADAANAVVETELFTPFSSLINPPINSSLPKVQYRYDLSGHRLSNSKQVDGNTTDIDLSRNLPDDASPDWFPSTANSNGVPNTWSDSITRAERKVFPEHKYDIYGYSMRHSLDPSGLTVGFTDASSAQVVDNISAWNTPVPPRSAATASTPGGYLDTLPNKLDTTIWQQSNDTSWTQGAYFVSAGAIKAFKNSKQIKTDLLFLNNGLDPFKNIATTIQSNSPYTIKIRANPDHILGIDASGEEIIRMRSNIFIDGTATSHSTDLDLSGVQFGFQGTHDLSGGYSLGAKGTDVSNNFLGWKTSDIVNAFDNGNITQEGGYYCGTELSGIDISNVNLTTYPDISNNSLQAGYKAIIYQELSGNSLIWTRYPTTAGGWYKIFNIATRPIEDITLSKTNSVFKIMDGYNGGTNYNDLSNNFRFGAVPDASGSTSNFFGLPILAKTSTDIVEYTISLENLDETWWPTDDNLIENLKFFIQGTGAGNAPGPSGYLNWSGQTITKSWSDSNGGANSYPKLDSASNPIQSLSGTFNLSGNTGSLDFGVDNNKYSRNLLPTTYSSSVSQPLFFIQGSYDNNILRLRRNNSSNPLETGTRRTIDAAFFGDVSKNRFEGNGVGPNGAKTLFWDYTFTDNATNGVSNNFQNVGEKGTSAPYNEYPFVEIGTGGNISFNSGFDHKAIMSSTAGEKQLMWSGPVGDRGFKHGYFATGLNPYINYTNQYWFGHHLTTFTVDYSNFKTSGEFIPTAQNGNGTAGGYYSVSDYTPWWEDPLVPTGGISADFAFSNVGYKVIVIKHTIPTTFTDNSTWPQPCVELSLTLDGTPTLIPVATPTDAQVGNKPLVWFLEDQGNASTPGFPLPPASSYPGYSGSRTGWKATHKVETTATYGTIMSANNMGCLQNSVLTSSGKVFDLTGKINEAYDIYFRILIPNKVSTSNRLSGYKITYKERNGGSVNSTNISSKSVDWT